MRHLTLIASTCAALLSGCASAPPPLTVTPLQQQVADTAPAVSLYERLGGLPAITAVVDRFVDRLVADPRTRRSFEGGINLKALKASIVAQVCNATGGRCKYEGESMIKAHHGLAITPLEFDTAIGHIRATLNELHVGAREQQEFLQIVLPMKSDIVGR